MPTVDKVETRGVRLWLRALLSRYEQAGLFDYLDWDDLPKLEIAEREVQEIFAEVGMTLAQLMQVEHGMNAVLRAERARPSDQLPKYEHLGFGRARAELHRLVTERCAPGILEPQLKVLQRANALRNHLVHGEVSLAIHSLDSPWPGAIAEVFWLGGDNSDALDSGDLRASRRLAEDALDAVVDIMATLRMP
jgi:hypothetical protein